MLGLSLGLGLNLASSLKRYAVILRWSLLTKRFVSLEVFDLILGLETLTKVGKLMIISLPRIRKSKMLRKLPWFREARDDGSRLTWIVCLVWLLVNIGAQVLVATLSLFWPVDTSDRIPLLTRGDVLISDLASWKLDSPGGENASALASANTFGVQGVYDILPADSGHDHRQDNTTKNVIYQGDGYYEYRFLNRNPNVPSVYLVSERVIQVRASCQQLTLDESGVFKHTNGRIYGNASLDGKHWELYPVPFYYEGSISWVGSRHAYCGSRCTNFTVFQKADDTNITVSSLFTCKNEVSLVQGGEKEFINLRPEDHDHIYSSDDFARIAAGAISWTGYTMANRVERQTRIYFTGEEWSPYKIVGADEVSDMIMRFSISAIAAFDDHGIQYIVPNQLNRPVQGQIVNADWGWILGLLGGICIIQFGALICLVAFANKAIIRDESFFSTALLLRPVVEKIGKGGVNLTGRDIKNHPKLRWRRIKYDYEEGRNGEPNEVRIKFEGSDLAGPRRSWAPGDYR
ncbi:hypothetical protein BCR34DRAFT_623663 [Clohesyomyces aquaticus]|uniref:Uncharacterized protein n=1 Tax=Clohesyomyces aquaticus TaxID=1231657 RepID=A0A1Y1ZUH3_9PLEO|nr:hypothetical protein BCR34DRAFT_623663 [Clohesyomyces aquaticus]